MHKRVLNENEAFKDTAILDFAEFDDLVKKIDSNKVTDKELQIARESMLEMANKIPKANNLLKEAKLALDFETFSKHADAQDFLEAELRKIWNKREDLPISQTNIDEITKAIDQALGGKPKFRTFKEQFETSTKKQISDADEKEIKALNRKLFGDDDVRITGQILANKPALGKYERGMIDIVDGQAKPKDTFYHETVHKYLDSFSTADEYKKALVEAKSRFNIKGSWSKVEEELAERFIDYAKTKEDDLSSGFFKKTLDRVKNYLKNKDSVDKLYNDILKGEAKKKTRGLAESVEAKAIKEDVAKTLGELPEYEVRGVKAKVDEALNLIADDEAKTIRIAMGEEKPPVGFIPEDFYVALVKKASSEGDAELLKMLATQSNLIDEATLMGQRIRTLGEIDPYSPVNKIKEVNKAKSDRLGNIKKKVDKEVKDIKRKTKATVEDWSSFVNSIKC